MSLVLDHPANIPVAGRPELECLGSKLRSKLLSRTVLRAHLQVKVWNVQSGFCFVTFSEHTSPVTAVTFLPSGSVIISASLDGTVRAFDLVRYRNFRTLTAPHPVQFASLAVDPAGEVNTLFLQSLVKALTPPPPPRLHPLCLSSAVYHSQDSATMSANSSLPLSCATSSCGSAQISVP